MTERLLDISRSKLTELAARGLSVSDMAASFVCPEDLIRRRMLEWQITLCSTSRNQERFEMTEEKKVKLGVGLDVGTMNLVSARQVGDQTSIRRVRDAFLDLEVDAKKMLQLSGVSYVEYDDRILILGDTAIETANLFKREARRPLSQGLISSSEIDALEVLSILIQQVIGDPSDDGEICYYSIPAAPVDVPNQDVVYHEAVFAKILKELGYTPKSGNEAMAIVYSECASDTFSGIGISFGSGMVNLALSYMTMPILEFSLARGGDWIDQQTAKALGTTASRVCALKEKGINLMAPETREQEALVVYYQSLIRYALENIETQFKKSQSDTELSKAIPIVLSGGTSLPEGFLELFREVFESRRKHFPIEVSEIRRAENPMTSVAEGLLVQAMQEYS